MLGPDPVTTEDIENVIDVIDEIDPDGEDDDLQMIRIAMRFAIGWEGTAAAFIRMHISD